MSKHAYCSNHKPTTMTYRERTFVERKILIHIISTCFQQRILEFALHESNKSMSLARTLWSINWSLCHGKNNRKIKLSIFFCSLIQLKNKTFIYSPKNILFNKIFSTNKIPLISSFLHFGNQQTTILRFADQKFLIALERQGSGWNEKSTVKFRIIAC